MTKNTYRKRNYARNVEKLVLASLKRSASELGLLAILLFGFISIYFFGDLIAPLLIALVLSYLLEMPINFLHQHLKCPRMLATIIIFGGFIGLATIFFLILMPMLWNQTISLLS